MSNSKKENILNKIESIITNIQIGNSPDGSTILYENSVSYVDRQYIGVSMNDIVNKPKPWILINNEGEDFKPFPSSLFESTMYVKIIGFVEALQSDKNLDSLMNSLQKDLLVAILTNVELSGLCDYVMPTDIQIVNELIWPYGGFVLNLEIVYTFTGPIL